MTQARRVVAGRTIRTMLLFAVLSACTQRQPAGAPASAGTLAATPSATAGPAAPAPEAMTHAGPRITLSPDNVHIEYHVYGSGEPAIVLVHGWAADANYWQAQIPALAAHYTVVALNLAGHGASGSNRSDWSIANYAGDVVAVARAIPDQQLILVGHSMGAAVALAAAPLLGTRVIGVVAVEALRSVGRPALGAHELDRRLAPFSADFIGSTRKLVTTSLFRSDADPTLVQKVAYDMSLEPQAIGVASMRSLLALDLDALLPAVHVPVYAINSDLSPTDAARIRKALPDFSLDVLDHSGHFLMMEDPARFNPLLLKDLAAIATRTAH
jgi:pimeloyl-ACP methyl ester carboxylesterase